ncbi:glucan endo-1,3-beta-glucosidase 8 [Ziziphus jujuba]|uniref:glucan endo-1,3-beta-D-glucosidase n=1 Tax=Ziziphus jujuba TaxID=326968 RepID=A0A6P3ZXX0_ZIZJJ|nr:glucan endo-1,3-beta-glucosidase 8 [Ziziphus jujuba]
MDRAGILVAWAVSMMMVSSNLVQGLGVNWGTMASHPLHPSIVANLLKDNGIKKVKLFDSDHWTVNALADSDIEVMIAIPNLELEDFAGSYHHAKKFVKQNVTAHLKEPGGVKIRYVGVGNEPFLKSYNGSFVKSTFPALQNVQKALDEAGVGDKIKATVPLNADVYESSSDKPSDGNFRPDIKDQMVEIVQFLNDNNAPFSVNIYPFLSLYQNDDFPVDFAFFDNTGRTINDKNLQYNNVFDANFDTLVWALKKAGFPNLKILVGEVGWPTDGHKSANAKSAKRFYDGLIKKLANNKGTPMKPGYLETYLFGLFDEDQKSVAPGPFERHWGIFRYDGQPKFPMDLSGQGRNQMLVPAKGVQYLEKKWCVLDSDVSDFEAVGPQVDFACGLSDCSSLGLARSCGELNAHDNVSYAFNMYFQTLDQSVEACDFKGWGRIVTNNASQGDCLFPIQIMSGGKRLGLSFAALVVTIFGGALMSFFLFV